ncbi:MAG: hypothetical protein JXA69_05260 [Phycisphaerae bacterium]|nr:hypothetical protein [Phycisphaerae bacterium]
MRAVWLAVVVAVSAVTAADGYMYDEADFPAAVVEYVEGSGVIFDWLSGEPFNEPYWALGLVRPGGASPPQGVNRRPTVDTTGDGFYIPPTDAVPVVPVGPPFRSFEVVTVGNGGYLIVEFEHSVVDDPRNPYGIDLIVFGNAMQLTLSGGTWHNGDPTSQQLLASSAIESEPGLVSVSQDGTTWYTFTSGPFADAFAPTLGRVFDPENPDLSLGTWNQWWAAPTNPTKPLYPRLTATDFNGMTVAEVAQAYEGSAGGTGFDISVFGLSWIRYVRIDDIDGPIATTEIDAIVDVRPCVSFDTDGDDDVDLADFGRFQACFNGPNRPPAMETGCHGADVDADGDVDLADFGRFQMCFNGPNRPCAGGPPH